MRRFLSVVLSIGVVALVSGLAFAQSGPTGGGMGPGMMGGGMMGGGAGQAGCPGMAATGAQTGQVTTEEKATELAQQYANTYLKGFTVEKVLPFTGMHGTMYSVELKGPEGQLRTLHVNPWGNVMPFGGPQRRSG